MVLYGAVVYFLMKVNRWIVGTCSASHDSSSSNWLVSAWSTSSTRPLGVTPFFCTPFFLRPDLGVDEDGVDEDGDVGAAAGVDTGCILSSLVTTDPSSRGEYVSEVVSE